MLRTLFAALFFLLSAATAQAQFRYSDPFDVRSLNRGETRALQAALVLSGDYDGLLDGAWGRGSQGSLDRWASRVVGRTEFMVSDLSDLMRPYVQDLSDSGWRMEFISISDTSFAFPANIVSLQADGPDDLNWESSGNQLSIGMTFADDINTRALHADLKALALRGSEIYESTRTTRLITSVSRGDGRKSYLRSDKEGDSWVSMTITATPAQETRMALIASSLQRGPALDLALDPNSVLAFASKYRESSPSSSTVGVAIYVNNTDLITAAHAVENCSALSLGGLEPVTVLAQDSNLNLALLTSAARADVWASFEGNTASKLEFDDEVEIVIPLPGRNRFDSLSGTPDRRAQISSSVEAEVVRVQLDADDVGAPVLVYGGGFFGVVIGGDAVGSTRANRAIILPRGEVEGFLIEQAVLYDLAPPLGPLAAALRSVSCAD